MYVYIYIYPSLPMNFHKFPMNRSSDGGSSEQASRFPSQGWIFHSFSKNMTVS